MNDAAAVIADRLTELWRRSRPTILERMALLHAACVSLEHDSGDGAARDSGREAAHKLSGVLGVFGLPRGSEIAASIELLLEPGESLRPDDLSVLRNRIASLEAVIASRP